ncbi:hypothetical protein NUBL21980_20510 [Klebsiella michiganensis]|nr:hypothetical protein NUBL21980_20510 [Klebsiella michiganensis]
MLGDNDVEKAANVFVQNEISAIAKKVQEINRWTGENIITFYDYTLSTIIYK